MIRDTCPCGAEFEVEHVTAAIPSSSEQNAHKKWLESHKHCRVGIDGVPADRPEGNTAAESVAQMVSQSAEMNGEDAFWRHMLRLPVAKFIGPMRNALRNYEAQSADRPECPKCGGSGTEEIKRQCGITEYWPCDCKASK